MSKSDESSDEPPINTSTKIQRSDGINKKKKLEKSKAIQVLSEKKKKPSKFSLTSLSDDTIIRICRYLNAKDLLNICFVSKSLKNMSYSEKLWKKLFRRNRWEYPDKRLFSVRDYYIKLAKICLNNWTPVLENFKEANKKTLISTFKKKKLKVLLMGFDGAGKTVALYQLMMGEAISSIPTVGFVEETIKYQKISVNVIEIGGNKTIRFLWEQFKEDVDAIIWMLDGNDAEKIEESKTELRQINDKLGGFNALLGIIINKVDLPQVYPSNKLAKVLELNKLSSFKSIYMQEASATSGTEGLWKMIDWICVHVTELKHASLDRK